MIYPGLHVTARNLTALDHFIIAFFWVIGLYMYHPIQISIWFYFCRSVAKCS